MVFAQGFQAGTATPGSVATMSTTRVRNVVPPLPLPFVAGQPAACFGFPPQGYPAFPPMTMIPFTDPYACSAGGAGAAAAGSVLAIPTTNPFACSAGGVGAAASVFAG